MWRSNLTMYHTILGPRILEWILRLSKLNHNIHLSVLPVSWFKGTSCLKLFLLWLLHQSTLHPGTVSQNKPFLMERSFSEYFITRTQLSNILLPYMLSSTLLPNGEFERIICSLMSNHHLKSVSIITILWNKFRLH